MKSVKKDHNQKHEFALFVENLSSLVGQAAQGTVFTLTDEKLFHRMMTVLRLSPGAQCVFFDKKINVSVLVREYSAKKNISCAIVTKNNNIACTPQVTFLLPLLKRDDFEQALYALTEVGVSTIQLVLSQKGHGVADNQKERDRAQRIIIAAAEQSKNFVYPDLKSPISLAQVVSLHKDDAPLKIFFDPTGCSLLPIMQNLHKESQRTIIVLIGPEGDLTDQEKEMIISQGFVFCRLTPTILRAVQAAALGAGIIRSLISR